MGKQKIKKKKSSIPQISKVDPKADIYQNDSGCILHSIEDTIIESGSYNFVQTGVKLYLPDGFVGEFRSMASMFINSGIYIHPAKSKIYPEDDGDMHILLKNESDEDYTIIKGTAIAVLKVFKIKESKILVNGVNL